MVVDSVVVSMVVNSVVVVIVVDDSVEVKIIGICEGIVKLMSDSGVLVMITGNKFAGGGRIVNNGTVGGETSDGR